MRTTKLQAERSAADFYEFGPFRLDASNRSLYRESRYVALTPKAFEILLLLVEEAGRVVTKEQVMQRVWPAAFVEEGSIANNISTLRKVLNPDFGPDGAIATVARRGYRFTAPVRLRNANAEIALASLPTDGAQPLPAAPAPDVAAAAPVAPPRSKRGHVAALAAAAVLMVIVVAVAVVPRLPSRGPLLPVVRRSVALLPLTNLSGQQDVAWLSPALTETIGAELAAGGPFRLVPAANVSRMRPQVPPQPGDALTRKQLDEIGRDLGAQLILTGGYLAVGGKVRVDVRLQDVTTGEAIATASGTDEEKNLVALVGRTGGDLRARLGFTPLGSREIAAVRASFPSTPESTRAYFLGLDALRLRDGPRASALLQQAIAAEPRFALAHSALSTTWRLLGYDRRGADEARLALDLSDRLSPEDRSSVEAQYYEASFSWTKAAERYKALWQSYGDNIEYGLKLTNAQTVAGQAKEARQTVAEMRRLPPPDAADARIDLAEAVVAERAADYRGALAAADRAIAKAQDAGALLLLARARHKRGIYLQRQGQLNEALAAFDDSRQLFDALGDPGGSADALRFQAGILVDRGQLKEAEQKLSAALQLARQLHYVRLTAEILMLQSGCERQRGALSLATATAESGLASAREAEDASAIGRLLTQLGVLLKLRGEYAKARAQYVESADILRRLGDAANVNSALNNIAAIDLGQGRVVDARASFEKLLQDERKTGNKTRIAIRLLNLSQTRALQGDLAEADGLAAEECALHEGQAAKANLASCRTRRALIWIALGRREDARAAIAAINAADLASTPQPPTDLARLATLYLVTGDRGKAVSTLSAADRSLAGREYIPEQAIPVAIAKARLDAASGQQAAAVGRLEKASRDAETFGLAPLLLESRFALAALAAEPGRRAAIAEVERDAKAIDLGGITVTGSHLAKIAVTTR